MNDMLYLRYRALLAQVLRVYILSRSESFSELLGDASASKQTPEELLVRLSTLGVGFCAPSDDDRTDSILQLILGGVGKASSNTDISQNVTLQLGLLRDDLSIACGGLDRESLLAQLSSCLELLSAYVVDSESNLMHLLSASILAMRYAIDSSRLAMHSITCDTPRADSVAHDTEDTFLKCLIDLVSTTNGEVQKTDTGLALQALVDALAHGRRAYAEAAFALSENRNITCSSAILDKSVTLIRSHVELLTCACVYAYAVLFSQALSITENICMSDINTADVERGYSNCLLTLINTALPELQQVEEALLQHVTRQTDVAMGQMQEIDESIMRLTAKLTSTLGAASQELDNIFVQLGYESVDVVAPDIREFDKFFITLGYLFCSKIYPEVRVPYSVLLKLSHEASNVVSPKIQWAMQIFYSDITKSIGSAFSKITEEDNIRMCSLTGSTNVANGYWLEMPSQRGNILRIPTAYSATQNGNVLVVI